MEEGEEEEVEDGGKWKEERWREGVKGGINPGMNLTYTYSIFKGQELATCTCIHHLIWSISYYLLTLPHVSNYGEMVVPVMDSHFLIMAATPGPQLYSFCAKCLVCRYVCSNHLSRWPGPMTAII